MAPVGPEPDPEPIVRLRGVRREYGQAGEASLALRDLDLEVHAGEMLALTGPSGSGKTTLLQLIGGLDLPSAGSVWVAGKELKGLREAEQAAFRLRSIGFVFQLFHLVPVLTAAENVELPLLFRRELSSRERARRVDRTLEQTGIREHAERRPAQLSGGEQQRVAIARALAGEPRLLLADEPTANLDQENAHGILDLMRRLNQELGTTVIYATHDLGILGPNERHLRLRDGRL